MDPGTLLVAPYALGGAWAPNAQSESKKSVSIATDSKLENYKRPFTSNHRFKAHNAAECERSIYSKARFHAYYVCACWISLGSEQINRRLTRILMALLLTLHADLYSCIVSAK